jgi:hypothetical protein
VTGYDYIAINGIGRTINSGTGQLTAGSTIVC